MSRFNESFSVPVGIKGTFWALIDFSLFAIGPNLHCSRIFCPLHWFLFLWLAIIDHTLHIWSTLLFHFWIRTDWNFLEVINGIIPLFYYMITLWPILVHNLGWIPWKWVRRFMWNTVHVQTESRFKHAQINSWSYLNIQECIGVCLKQNSVCRKVLDAKKFPKMELFPPKLFDITYGPFINKYESHRIHLTIKTYTLCPTRLRITYSRLSLKGFHRFLLQLKKILTWG